MSSAIPAYKVANLLLAAHSMLRDGHVAGATHLMVTAEELVQRVADPVAYLNLMTQLDRLWHDKLIDSGLRPQGVVPPTQGDVQ
jgi:hypothetical protein